MKLSIARSTVAAVLVADVSISASTAFAFSTSRACTVAHFVRPRSASASALASSPLDESGDSVEAKEEELGVQSTGELIDENPIESALLKVEEDHIADESSVAVESVVESDNTLEIENSILRMAASTDRGQNAKLTQKNQVQQWIEELESKSTESTPTNPGDVLSSSLAGTWELLYSNTQLFRSSPFFLAGRATCKTPEEAQQYDWFCDMHRAALAISTIGTVRQILAKDGKLVNEFEVKVGAVPFLSDFLPMLKYSGGLPFTIDGAIVSTADLSPTHNEDGSFAIHMDEVAIRGSNVPLLRSLLDSPDSKLKSRDLSQLLEDNVSGYETPRPLLRTTYVDASLRIVRDQDDNIFVYSRVSDNEEPTNYSSVLPDLGVASLLEEFNDSVTKIYL